MYILPIKIVHLRPREEKFRKRSCSFPFFFISFVFLLHHDERLLRLDLGLDFSIVRASTVHQPLQQSIHLHRPLQVTLQPVLQFAQIAPIQRDFPDDLSPMEKHPHGHSLDLEPFLEFSHAGILGGQIRGRESNSSRRRRRRGRRRLVHLGGQSLVRHARRLTDLTPRSMETKDGHLVEILASRIQRGRFAIGHGFQGEDGRRAGRGAGGGGGDSGEHDGIQEGFVGEGGFVGGGAVVEGGVSGGRSGGGEGGGGIVGVVVGIGGEGGGENHGEEGNSIEIHFGRMRGWMKARLESILFSDLCEMRCGDWSEVGLMNLLD